MKVIYSYMADDGAIFATPEECEAYEKEKSTKLFNNANVLFFDEEGRLLEGSFTYLMEQSCYMYIHTQEDFYKLVKINNSKPEYHYNLPECAGLWRYNFATDEYEDYKKQLNEYKEELKKYERISDNIYVFLDKIKEGKGIKNV